MDFSLGDLQMRPTVYFSNQMEQLAVCLGEQLFKKGGDPFEKKLVLLPSHTLKLYLSSFFARHSEWQICAGVAFRTLRDADVWTHLCKAAVFPSQLALSFAVERELRKIGKEESENPLFAPLKSYGISSQEDLKTSWVSEELSRLFYEYSTKERQALEVWLSQGGWQQEIWNRVFSQQTSWKCLSRQTDFSYEGTIALFGFSFLPSFFYQGFCELGSHFYFL
ncbi:MAG: exonuclease V subunit gamma, partial [Chlamydiae bacterium]|nr:exonuclease V subunit gamma [Chlamydiota bacterium]